MSQVQDRMRNKIDGAYVNAPDLHIVEPSRNIGLREFNNSVLIHNWFEDRTPAQKTEHKKTSTYELDFKPYPDAKPDVVLRRKLIARSEGAGSKHLIGMHDFDSSKNMISLYDQDINRRPRPEPEFPLGQKLPAKRDWKIINDCWIPEKSDHPLLDSPTKWGLVDKKRNDTLREQDKYRNQLPNLSEYAERFQKHSRESYLQRSKMAIPKELSTNFYDINKKLNYQPMPRSNSTSAFKAPQTRDVMDDVYNNMLVKSEKAPRTFYYLGKVPTNGALDVYSMKDFQTLTPVYQPTLLNQTEAANKNTDLSTYVEKN